LLFVVAGWPLGALWAIAAHAAITAAVYAIRTIQHLRELDRATASVPGRLMTTGLP
jgi:hypothetical protein